MADSQSSVSLCSLLCQETEQCFDEDSFTNLKHKATTSETDDEFVEALLRREVSFGIKSPSASSAMIPNWIKSARSEAIAWFLNMRDFFGFRFQTVYLSVTYVDRFLSTRSIASQESWVIPLLSVACLSLAAKMEECSVPSLSEFQLEEYEFESKVIQRMELLVLSTLGWRLGSITPFAYIQHFIAKLSNESSKCDLVPRAVELIYTLMRGNHLSISCSVHIISILILFLTAEMYLTDLRPSVIAASAALTAADKRLSRKDVELKINSICSAEFFDLDDVCSCYSVMQELQMKCGNISNAKISPNPSPYNLSRTKSITSAVRSIKRKRLRFLCDQNCDEHDEERLRRQ